MKTKHLKIRLFSSLIVMGSLLVTGCSDSDYDFNNIDATIGIGGDGLELPVSNTDNIKLSEVLDLEENGSVVADASTGFDYVFRQQGNDVEAAHPYINSITWHADSQAPAISRFLSTLRLEIQELQELESCSMARATCLISLTRVTSLRRWKN